MYPHFTKCVSRGMVGATHHGHNDWILVGSYWATHAWTVYTNPTTIPPLRPTFCRTGDPPSSSHVQTYYTLKNQPLQTTTRERSHSSKLNSRTVLPRMCFNKPSTTTGQDYPSKIGSSSTLWIQEWKRTSPEAG